MIYIAAHAIGLALLFGAFHATGALCARAIPAIDVVGRRTGLVRLLAGVAIWMYALFAFSAVGILRRGVLLAALAAVFVAIALVSARERREFVNDDPRSGAADDRWPTTAHAAAWVAPAIVLVLLFIGALNPWVGWDDMVAHLAIPKIYLQHGGFVRVPFNAYSNWPLNVELLYALAIAVQDYALAKLVHLAFLGLLAVAVYRFAARSAAPWAGLAAASLLLANDVVQVEAATANIDIAVGFFFFMAASLAVEFRETGDRRSLVMCGIACGCMAGSKITGLAALACVLPLVLAGPAKAGHYVQRVVLLTVPALALASPWLLKNFIYTGDPMYPVLWKYFHGIDWNATIDGQFWRWQQSIGMGRSLRDYALLPVRVILFGGGDYRHFAAWISKAWIVLVPVALVASPFVAVVRRCLIPAGLYFVVWAFTSQQTRFLISILPLLSVSAAIAMSWGVTGASSWLTRSTPAGAESRRRLSSALASLVIAGCLAHLASASRFIVRPARDLARGFLEQPPDLRTWVPHPVFAVIRDRLPPAARIMLVNTNHGFFIDRDYIADSFFEASQLNALVGEAGGEEGLTALFKRLGVTHVLVKRENWVPFPQTLWNYLADRDHVVVIYDEDEYALYELTRRSVKPPSMEVAPPR